MIILDRPGFTPPLKVVLRPAFSGFQGKDHLHVRFLYGSCGFTNGSFNDRTYLSRSTIDRSDR